MNQLWIVSRSYQFFGFWISMNEQHGQEIRCCGMLQLLFLYSMDGTGWILTAKVVYTSRKGRSGWTNSLMRSMSFARRTVSFNRKKKLTSFWNAGTKKSLNSSLAAAGDCLYIPNNKGTRCDHLQRCQEKTKWSDRLLLALPGRWPSSSRRVSRHQKLPFKYYRHVMYTDVYRCIQILWTKKTSLITTFLQVWAWPMAKGQRRPVGCREDLFRSTKKTLAVLGN